MLDVFLRWSMHGHLLLKLRCTVTAAKGMEPSPCMRPLPPPSCQRLHSSSSAMWDNVISWLEYSLCEMRFSYSVTRVIISWPIVSMQRLLVHPSLPLAISLLVVHPSFSPPPCISISLVPRHHSCCLSVTVSQFPHTFCIPFFAPCNFLLNLIIWLSFSLAHSFHPVRLAHSVFESHISAMREIKFLPLPLWLCLSFIGYCTYSYLPF